MFQYPNVANLGEIMKVLSLFPKFIDEDANKALKFEVTCLELKAILQWFIRGESITHDGILVEFYIVFFLEKWHVASGRRFKMP